MPQTLKSDAFQWNDTEEWFKFLIYRFDIKAAKAIIRKKPRKIVPLDLPALAKYFQTDPRLPGVMRMGVEVDWEAVKRGGYDADFPVIMAQLDKLSTVVIDGYHRAARASLDGKETIPCVLLTLKETKEVMR